ncbi:MAG: hypothetical protein M0T77_13855, partial [Actinomycetota bacterium]|nr:hypothetical protein [Actinomycetota bacterium]
MTATAASAIDVTLAEVEEACGTAAFKRGLVYARAHRVLSPTWDDGNLTLHAKVVGNGAIYETTAQFSRYDDEPEGDGPL